MNSDTPPGWHRAKIGQIAEVVGGGTPSTKDPENFGGDIPWLTPKDLSGYQFRYVTRGERNLTEKGLRNSGARLLPKDSVLLTSRAPIGYLAIAQNPISTNQGFRSLVLHAKYDPLFVYYLLKTNTAILEQRASGSTFKELSGSTLKEIEFSFPPLEKQRRIAYILGTLDDKIELNRKMNQTLEAIARAIFKSWFVDFDPVIDNALAAGKPIPEEFAERAARRAQLDHGKSPLPENIRCLFPDEFQDSELGPIPMGWEVVSFEELVKAMQGKYLPKQEIAERPSGEYLYPVWGGNGIRGYTGEYLYDKSVVVLTCRGSNCGRIDKTGSPAWISNIAFACFPKYGSVNFLYIYFRFVSFKSYITGSAQPQLTYQNLKTKIMEYPVEKNIVISYSHIIKSLFEQISLNNNKMITLATLRDTLLPRLVSGEIQVKDEERFVRSKVL